MSSTDLGSASASNLPNATGWLDATQGLPVRMGRGVAGAASPREWLDRAARLALRSRSWSLILLHVIIFTLVYYNAYLLRFEGQFNRLHPAYALAMLSLPLIVAVKLGVFLAMKSHHGWWRYASFVDLIHIVEAATISSAIVGAINYFGLLDLYMGATGSALRSLGFGPDSTLLNPAGISQIPRSVVLLDWAGTLLIIGGLRGSSRLFRERYFPMIAARSPVRALVVGASEEGLAIVRSIQARPELGIKVVGSLDDDPTLHGRVMSGIKVLGSPVDASRLALRHEVQTILVPTPTVPPSEVRELLEACAEARVKVQVVPVFDSLVKGDLTVQPRDVDIHDLLCREPVKLDHESVGRFLRGKVVMVTGAAGSIGSEICRQTLLFQPEKLILVDHSENGLFYIDRELRAIAGKTEIVTRVASIADMLRLRITFEAHRPAVVFHAAAHKHVPMMEENPGEAVKNNVFGTRVLVDESVRAGVEAFVMISTDKAVNPTSVMGACKRLAEKYVNAMSGRSRTRMVTVRFGNVLGSNGSVVPLFKEQVRRGGPVTVTHPDMTRYFMTIPEASQLVLQAGSLGKGGEIFVLDMGKPVKVLDLARDLIRLSGLTEGREIQIKFTGLRPGEKLYEELYDASEERVPTPHPKIFTAKHRPSLYDELAQEFDRLREVVNRHREDEVIAALKGMIPEYTPQRPGAVAHVNGNGVVKADPGSGFVRNGRRLAESKASQG